MKKIITFIIFLCCFSIASAQTGEPLPVQFIQFFKTYNLINPASIGRDSSAEFNVGNKMLGGAFSGVQTFYANANFNLRSTQNSKHVLGFTFMNDKEGSYIHKSRASLVYALHIPLSQRVVLQTGVSIGFINYNFKPSNITEGGSAFAPNADVGIWLRRSDFNIGVSSNQIISSQLTPIDQTYTINRYYNFIADKTFELSYNIALKPAFIYSWMDQNTYNAETALLAYFHQNLLLGVGYKYQRGVSASIGMENIQIAHQKLKMTLSYFSPSGNMTFYNPPSYELSLSYIPFFRKHVKEEELEQE